MLFFNGIESLKDLSCPNHILSYASWLMIFDLSKHFMMILLLQLSLKKVKLFYIFNLLVNLVLRVNNDNSYRKN